MFHRQNCEATTETIPMEEVEPVVQVKPEVEEVEEQKVEELKVGFLELVRGKVLFIRKSWVDQH